MLGLDLEEGRKDAGVGDSPGSRAGAGTARSQAPSPGPWRNTLPQVPHLGRNYSFRGEGSIQEGVGRGGSGKQLVVWPGYGPGRWW